MSLRIGRTLPPAVAPISFSGIIRGMQAMVHGERALRAFADQLKAFFNVKHCFLLSSGKASLTMVLQELKTLFPDRDEVVIPAFTCYSVPAAIVRAGLKIRLCDIEPETLDFDYGELAGQLSGPRVLCVIPTHLFGVTADIPRVREMIGLRGITIVEDAAQAMGAESKGCKAGTLGDVGLFSLGRGKAFSTVSGGIILTNSDTIGNALSTHYDAVPACSLYEQLKLAIYAAALAVLSRPGLFWIPKALPFLGLGETHFDTDFPIKQMSPLQAGLASGWQDRLPELGKIRRNNAAYLYKSGIKAVGGTALLASGPIRFPYLAASGINKQALLYESGRSGSGGADVYPDTVDGIAELQDYIVGGTSVKAGFIAKRIITFPLHPFVTEADFEKMLQLIKKTAGNV